MTHSHQVAEEVGRSDAIEGFDLTAPTYTKGNRKSSCRGSNRLGIGGGSGKPVTAGSAETVDAAASAPGSPPPESEDLFFADEDLPVEDTVMTPVQRHKYQTSLLRILKTLQ